MNQYSEVTLVLVAVLYPVSALFSPTLAVYNPHHDNLHRHHGRRPPLQKPHRAVAATKLAPVNRFNFTYYVQNSPFFALDIMEIMAERLREQLEKK